jgi:hypothetical protein
MPKGSFAKWRDAEWYLEHSAALSPCVSGSHPFHGLPSFRLWDGATGFAYQAEPASLTVFEIPKDVGYEFVVREVVWRQWVDLQDAPEASDSVTKDDPTLVVRDASVPTSEWVTLLTEAENFQVPIVWPQAECGITSDANTVGFEFFSSDQPPACLRLQWSESAPESWKPIIAWWQRVRIFLEDCLAKGAQPGRTSRCT